MARRPIFFHLRNFTLFLEAWPFLNIENKTATRKRMNVTEMASSTANNKDGNLHQQEEEGKETMRRRRIDMASIIILSPTCLVKYISSKRKKDMATS